MFRVHTPITYITRYTVTTHKHTLHIVSFFTAQKTICCNSTSNAPDVPETCRAKKTSIKLPYCNKLAFHILSWGKGTVKQPPRTVFSLYCLAINVNLFSYCVLQILVCDGFKTKQLSTDTQVRHILNVS